MYTIRFDARKNNNTPESISYQRPNGTNRFLELGQTMPLAYANKHVISSTEISDEDFQIVVNTSDRFQKLIEIGAVTIQKTTTTDVSLADIKKMKN